MLKSVRLTLAVAVAPQASFFSIGWGMQWKDDGQGHRLGDALEGQVAFDGGRLVAVEVHLGGLVGGGGVLGGVEEVFALDVLVEQG
jgi:hypothetical protein